MTWLQNPAATFTEDICRRKSVAMATDTAALNSVTPVCGALTAGSVRVLFTQK